jgi:hypothetical protein
MREALFYRELKKEIIVISDFRVGGLRANVENCIKKNITAYASDIRRRKNARYSFYA